MMGPMTQAFAHLGGRWATGVSDVTNDLGALDGGGRWAVLLPYSGLPVAIRFRSWLEQPRVVRPMGLGSSEVGPIRWQGPPANSWNSSVDEPEYLAAVEEVRTAIAAGSVYQANICRVLSAQLPDTGQSDLAGLYELLRVGNPAPYSGMICAPELGIEVVTASPELFLERQEGVIRSGPIKGTGKVAGDLTAKDEAENVMIVDLVRNDLSKVCATGSVTVPELLKVEVHPGLVHLASYISGTLLPDAGWPQIIEATFPPGSITGAPKSSAIRIIGELEPAPREYYCGAIGWVDADEGTACLAVAIRTFWKSAGQLHFGTGAGITWSSDAQAEWRETQLKAAHLTTVAAGSWQS